MSETGHQPSTVRHPDRRVARTRTAIVDAFTDLARSSPVRDITVSELSDRAQIGRSTFYDHFDGIEDLLCWLVDELVTEMSADDGHLQLDELLAFVGGMPEVSRAFLEIESCAERCRTALAEAFPCSNPSARYFAAAGTMGLLTQWLHSEQPVPLNELIGDIHALVEAVIASPAGPQAT